MKSLALGCVCLLLLVGCDMAEYQRRMDLSRARVKIFDEENKVLDNGLVKPTILQKDLEVPAWPFDVFARFPRGIGSAALAEKDHGVLPYQDFLAFRYPGDSEGYGIMVAAGYVGEPKKAREKSKDGDKSWPRYSPQEFRENLLHALHDYFRVVYLGNMKYDPEFKTLTQRNVDVPSPGAEKPVSLAFDIYSWDGVPGAKGKEALAYTFYHHHTADKQVAFVFQMPASKKDDLNEQKKMEMSVRTLALGDAAVARREEYRKLHRK